MIYYHHASCSDLNFIFFVATFCHINITIIFSKIPQSNSEGNFLEKFPKKLSHFEEESYEIASIFGGFGQVFSFILLKSPYLPTMF
jgi:hypothetical protein